MDQREFYKRVNGTLNLERIQAARVVVVGLGSGGCRVSAELGRLGVPLMLVERPGESLEEHNIVRHLLGYESLGKPKLSEMVRFIRNLNPSTPVKTCSLDVVDNNDVFGRTMADWNPDLILVCTDNEQSKHAVNHVAIELAKPQIGAGVYDGGIGGEVYRAVPGQACYGCIAAHLQLEGKAPAQKSSPDYNSLDPWMVPTTCALNIDIAQIALLQARLALDLLLGQPPEFLGISPKANLCVFSNRVVPGTFSRPLHARFFHVPRKENCLDCGESMEDIEAEAKRIVSALSKPPKPVGQGR